MNVASGQGHFSSISHGEPLHNTVGNRSNILNAVTNMAEDFAAFTNLYSVMLNDCQGK